MKIIFASKFYYHRGGLESYLFKTKALLEAHGHQVIPFSTDYPENYKTEYSEFYCKYHNLSKEAFSLSPNIESINATVNMFFNREAYTCMRKLINKTKPDIVQGFGVTKHLSYSIFKAAKDMGVPTVMRLSDFALLCANSTATDYFGKLCPEIYCSENNFKKILTKKCIHNSMLASFIGALEVKFNLLFGTYKKYVDYFIAPSRFLRDSFIQHYGISPERIIYLPVYNELQSIPSDKDDAFFLFAGRLSDEKGIITLLKAGMKSSGHKIVIAGTGPSEDKYKTYSEKNKINVEFVGHEDFESLQSLIKKCRAVIVPSECYENSPNIVLEAYSYGKPVIGTRVGGIPELIEDKKTGLLFELGNDEELAEKMKLLHDDKNLAVEMGNNGRKILEAKFMPEKHYEELEKFYNSVTKKKILLVNNFFYNRGGDCTYLFALKKCLEENGHRTVVFSMQHPQNFDSIWSKYFVNYINYDEEVKTIGLISGLRVATRTIFFFKARHLLKKLIKKEKPDIAHLQNIHHHITPSILYPLKKHKIPVIWTLHDYQLICPNISFLADGKICEKCKNNKYFWPPIIKCKKGSMAASLMSAIEIMIHNAMGISRLVDIFIAPSEFIRNKFIEYGYDKEKVVCQPYVVNFNLKHDKNETGDYYLYIGRISEEKGIKTLINASIKANSGKLKIVGDGPLKDEMISYVSSKNGNENVEFLGHKTHNEVMGLLEKCQFTIVPSEWYENYPYAILEAFAVGKPVIGAKIGGIPELVHNAETGLLFETGNVDDLSLKIKYLIENPDKAAELGNNARLFTENELNSKKHYQKLIEIYNQAS
jgi:glycosyltransferase involved in cell wall biosynthesis